MCIRDRFSSGSWRHPCAQPQPAAWPPAFEVPCSSPQCWPLPTGAGQGITAKLECPSRPWPHLQASAPPVSGAGVCARVTVIRGGSPSCCAAGLGTTIPGTAARPTGTGGPWTTATTTAVSASVVSPQHPSPSEPLEGIPAGAHEGSRPVPEIGSPIRTSPDRCALGVTLGAGGLFVERAGDKPAARALPYPLVKRPNLNCDWKRQQSRGTTANLNASQRVIH